MNGLSGKGPYPASQCPWALGDTRSRELRDMLHFLLRWRHCMVTHIPWPSKLRNFI